MPAPDRLDGRAPDLVIVLALDLVIVLAPDLVTALALDLVMDFVVVVYPTAPDPTANALQAPSTG